MADEGTDDKQRSGEPWRKFRMDDKLWDSFGALVGTRKRSEIIRSLIQWLLTHGTADLSEIPEEQLLDFFVRVHISNAGGKTTRRAEVINIHGSKGPGIDEARRRIMEAIVGSFNEEPPPQTPPTRSRKAAK